MLLTLALPVALLALTALLVILLAPIRTGGDEEELTQQEVAATATALAAEHADGSGDATPGPAASVFKHPDPESLPIAIVLEVIDGDTIEARVEDRTETVRYYGVDTPERYERCYEEAKERNEELAGRHVLLMADARDRDSGGRLLRYVFTLDGRSIDGSLLAEGLARAWTRDGFYRDALMAVEEEARREGRGCLWGDGGEVR
jgi:micrococcal nuclease